MIKKLNMLELNIFIRICKSVTDSPGVLSHVADMG